ncbi:MAG: glycosyltransferase family 2 protein, partial [Thermoflexales bacterium]
LCRQRRTRAVVGTIADGRVRYVYQKNAGRSAARNRGIDLSVGEFICFLDDDDMFLRHKLEAQLAELAAHPELDLISGGHVVVNADGIFTESRPARCHFELTETQFLFDCPFVVGAPLLRKRCVGLGIRFERDYVPSEDWGFWLDLAKAGCRMAWLDSEVYVYRQHQTNSLRSFDPSASAIVAILDRYFLSERVPAESRAVRGKVMGRAQLSLGIRLSDSGHHAKARAALSEAVGLWPAWQKSERGDLATLIADTVVSLTFNHTGRGLAARVVVNLGGPRSVDNGILLSVYCTLALKDFYRAYGMKDWLGATQAILGAIRSRPSCLLNRGLLKMSLIAVRYALTSTGRQQNNAR